MYLRRTILLLFLIFVSFRIDAQVDIVIPDIQESGLLTNDTFSLIITTSDLTGLGVISFQFTLVYDPTIVLAVDVNTFGTVLDVSGWSVMPNLNTPGEIRVIGWGVDPLAGSGDFISLLFEVLNPSGFTDLTATEFLFNAGTPTVTVVDGSIQLPVELISFKAAYMNNTVLLEWITATEVNNKGFEIQRFTPNQLDQEWKVLVFVDGNGTTSEVSKYSYTDLNPLAGDLLYRLRQMDYDGTTSYSDIVEISIDPISSFTLYQNFPNPFNPTTEIKFDLARSGFVRLNIFNGIGELVAELINEKLDPGNYSETFSAIDLPSGIYFYNLQISKSQNSPAFNEFRKMVLLK